MLRAVRSNNAVRMRSLVLMGADVNARDETGRTALHTAATMVRRRSRVAGCDWQYGLREGHRYSAIVGLDASLF